MLCYAASSVAFSLSGGVSAGFATGRSLAGATWPVMSMPEEFRSTAAERQPAALYDGVADEERTREQAEPVYSQQDSTRDHSEPVADRQPLRPQNGMVDTPRNVMKNFDATGEVLETFDANKVMETIRDAGVAGIISYGVVQLGFFGAAIPAGLFGYYKLTGHWPDLSNAEDQAQLTAEALTFLGFSRLLIPARIALALALTQGVQTNILDNLKPKASANPASTSLECNYCYGSGQLTCGHCLSTGMVSVITQSGAPAQQPCGNCGTTGKVICINCQGTGISVPEDDMFKLGDAQMTGFTEKEMISLLGGEDRK